MNICNISYFACDVCTFCVVPGSYEILHRYTTNVINIECCLPAMAEPATDLTNGSNFRASGICNTDAFGFVVDDGRLVRSSLARYRSLTSSFDF